MPHERSQAFEVVGAESGLQEVSWDTDSLGHASLETFYDCTVHVYTTENLYIVNCILCCHFAALSNQKYFVLRLIPIVFCNLFSTMPGGKKLCIPRTSQSFQWNASEVISTAAQGSLYIMATIPPLKDIKKESAVCFHLIIHILF